MTSSDPADAPLDGIDDAILGHLRAVGDSLDPVPPDLDERVLFAIGLDTLEFELARIQEDSIASTGARVAEPIRAVTFDGRSLTIMATLAAVDERGHRIEGWLTPAGRHRVELRSTGFDHGARSVVAERSGRFVFDGVPAGLAQFVVRLDPDARTVVTSPLTI